MRHNKTVPKKAVAKKTGIRALTEDEEDVLISEEIIRTEKFYPLEEVLRDLGYKRVEGGRGFKRAARNPKSHIVLPKRNGRRSRRP